MNISPLPTGTVTYTSTGQTRQRGDPYATAGSAAVGEDTVTFSDSARLLGRLSTFLDGAGEDGVITMEELRTFRDTKLGQVQDMLRDTMAELGIDQRAKFTVERDGWGRFSVQGRMAEKDKQALATALTANDTFQNAYAAADSTATILAAGEASLPFQEAYAADPQQAVRQFAWLFTASWNFSLSFENGAVDFDVTHS